MKSEENYDSSIQKNTYPKSAHTLLTPHSVWNSCYRHKFQQITVHRPNLACCLFFKGSFIDTRPSLFISFLQPWGGRGSPLLGPGASGCAQGMYMPAGPNTQEKKGVDHADSETPLSISPSNAPCSKKKFYLEHLGGSVG